MDEYPDPEPIDDAEYLITVDMDGPEGEATGEQIAVTCIGSFVQAGDEVERIGYEGKRVRVYRLVWDSY